MKLETEDICLFIMQRDTIYAAPLRCKNSSLVTIWFFVKKLVFARTKKWQGPCGLRRAAALRSFCFPKIDTEPLFSTWKIYNCVGIYNYTYEGGHLNMKMYVQLRWKLQLYVLFNSSTVISQAWGKHTTTSSSLTTSIGSPMGPPGRARRYWESGTRDTPIKKGTSNANTLMNHLP